MKVSDFCKATGGTIQKFNENHGEDGKFSSGGSGGWKKTYEGSAKNHDTGLTVYDHPTQGRLLVEHQISGEGSGHQQLEHVSISRQTSKDNNNNKTFAHWGQPGKEDGSNTVASDAEAHMKEKFGIDQKFNNPGTHSNKWPENK